MIKNALRYLMEEMAPAQLHSIDGKIFSDKPLTRISHNPKAKALQMTTLTSLVEYIRKSGEPYAYTRYFVHVESPTCVELYSELDDDRVRECLVQVNANLPKFPFNQFMGHEEFCINLQSKFMDAEDRGLMLKFAGTVEAGTVSEYGDDGVTQKATIKTGIASKGEALIPNPVKLVAYRTFLEVEQPECQYIFRMKDDKFKGIQCALFEADGGAWERRAMDAIKEYLDSELVGIENLIILS